MNSNLLLTVFLQQVNFSPESCRKIICREKLLQQVYCKYFELYNSFTEYVRNKLNGHFCVGYIKLSSAGISTLSSATMKPLFALRIFLRTTDPFFVNVDQEQYEK